MQSHLMQANQTRITVLQYSNLIGIVINFVITAFVIELCSSMILLRAMARQCR
ncbi:hypothetical protein EV681_0333 [Advenella incenata]|uniref:Uncharacterized protein n=1 Tax=Advenella incenata TaxID=267800 RepID=A0A4V2FTK5_9BURK|nr:hypothetical protein EV681_0333 [Advenella incenata]